MNRRCDWNSTAQPRDGAGPLRVAVFIPDGAPRELIAELSLWRAVELVRLPLNDPILAAPLGSLQARVPPARCPPRVLILQEKS